MERVNRHFIEDLYNKSRVYIRFVYLNKLFDYIYLYQTMFLYNIYIKSSFGKVINPQNPYLNKQSLYKLIP
jgi:hypothetical protein